MYQAIALTVGWIADKLLGDPAWLPHPIVLFGKAIAAGERRLNKGTHRRAKGGVMATVLIVLTFCITAFLLHSATLLPFARPLPEMIFSAILIFYCLAGTTLSKEVRMVFDAADRSLDDGRRQVGRIVGRDTSSLTDQEVRKAALETLAENLSDGVTAPLFWLLLLGVPGMMAYKMINTLDSMIGYRTERYRLFGTVAARIDDAANYIPARLTAILMIFVTGKPRLWSFVCRHSSQHASPNSGWPEAALAGILDCRFGGIHTYFGETIEKPYIGNNERTITSADMRRAIAVNQRAEVAMVIVAAVVMTVVWWV
ncbi:MAG: adenosylcobinamide-phosphate synthase CbiB [Prevotella sp.]|uniref:adenosylcobinamide-phosphate synthase CbiB n=1 Tax=Prevotella sp. TaxID=59823 RepID=UPI002A2A249A|nr:adenosylcobinamide-phosphate synthase CbiB [Prevotella sp.]MDD7317796.1 adenosylcobinamide-phosphate synthase CbiB [Prevotellaceae bacterium]MDY4020711.1 adenosylcobinamide-phosphate synthase CbiB [Prevotella sp.]